MTNIYELDYAIKTLVNSEQGRDKLSMLMGLLDAFNDSFRQCLNDYEKNDIRTDADLQNYIEWKREFANTYQVAKMLLG